MSVSRNVKEKREGERRNTSHGLGVVSVAANPLGFVTASSSLDNFVRVFNVNSNATIATLKAPPFEVEVWKMHFDPKLVKFLLKQANVDKRTCDLFGNRDLMNIAHNVARSLKVSYKNSATALVKEVRAMESSYPPKEPKCILFPSQMLSSEVKLVLSTMELF
ncbi:hypothetical protein JHK87_050258 [Glycine soja]|nr:hypothetical protein JHK87_050258 [Glycine soja]